MTGDGTGHGASDPDPVAHPEPPLGKPIHTLSGAYAASMDRHRLATALVLAMPALASRWSHVFVPTTPIRAAALVTSLVFYVYTIVLLLHYVLRTDDVTADEIFGAVSVYIPIGLAEKSNTPTSKSVWINSQACTVPARLEHEAGACGVEA